MHIIIPLENPPMEFLWMCAVLCEGGKNMIEKVIYLFICSFNEFSYHVLREQLLLTTPPGAVATQLSGPGEHPASLAHTQNLPNALILHYGASCPIAATGLCPDKGYMILEATLDERQRPWDFPFSSRVICKASTKKMQEFEPGSGIHSTWSKRRICQSLEKQS